MEPTLADLRFDFDESAEAELALSQHSRIHPTPARVKFFRDADEFSVDETTP